MTINDPRDDPQYQVGGDKYRSPVERGSQSAPDAKAVEQFHTKADTDAGQQAIHHTLGPKHDQSAAGDHNHQTGSNYTPALKGVTISGAKGGNVALASVIAALVKLGATDTTTA